MKKTSFISIVLLLLFGSTSFYSCKKKTFDDALPQITLVSATVSNLDSVLLVANITSAGANALEYCGFAYSANPSFSVLNRQVLFQATGTGKFQAVVPAIHDSTYYFKAFAANGFGYNVSNVIKYTVPTPAPAIAPCTLTNNYVNDGGLGFSVSSYGSAANPQWGGYTVTLNGTNEDIAISFPYKPINGVYNTVSDGSTMGAGQACVSITNFNIYYVNNGGKIYVSVNSNGTTTISFCSLTYNNGFSNTTIYGEATF